MLVIAGLSVVRIALNGLLSFGGEVLSKLSLRRFLGLVGFVDRRGDGNDDPPSLSRRMLPSQGWHSLVCLLNEEVRETTSDAVLLEHRC